ncbi:hypothetical protein Tco_1563499 [Tanacetum coccineum]
MIPMNPEKKGISKQEGHSQKEDLGYVDSGYSRHMTGNMSYLSNFKEFDGGYVTFGGGARGGRITGVVVSLVGWGGLIGSTGCLGGVLVIGCGGAMDLVGVNGYGLSMVVVLEWCEGVVWEKGGGGVACWGLGVLGVAVGVMWRVAGCMVVVCMGDLGNVVGGLGCGVIRRGMVVTV